MGYYIKFISKELILRKGTPQEIIDFLNDCVNNHKFEVKWNDTFFTLERWNNIFMSNYWLKEKTYFKEENGYWKFRTAVEINYGREEILEFAKWITPYITGHKPKEFIGELQGESRDDRQNVYIIRPNYTSKLKT